MDILAARKKAAELAKTAKKEAMPEPSRPAAAPDAASAQERPTDAFPPVHATTIVPDGPETVPVPASAAPGDASTGHAPPADNDLVSGQEPPVPEAGPREAAEPEEEHEQELEMLAFRLGNEEYVLPVEIVGEVLTPREITAVPHVPSYIPGVCSLRGAILPIIDLRLRLGLGGAERDERSRIIVVVLGPDDRIGLLVDRVQGVVRILPSSVRPAPETVAQGEGAAFLRGIARKEDRLFILLDAEKVTETEERTEKSR
jgi:purine-binding chemotaxis protein CheW